MADRNYGPSIRSLAPDIGISLFQACLAGSLWLTYPHVPHGISRDILLIFAILFTAVQVLFVHVPLLGVATKRITVGPLAVSSRQGWRCRLLWRDVGEVKILEKYRPFLPPRRTDRLVWILPVSIEHGGANMIICNPSAWPRVAEDEFLHELAQKADQYGFRLSRRTTRI